MNGDYILRRNLIKKLKKIRKGKNIEIDPRIFNAIKDYSIDKNTLLEEERKGRWIIMDL